MPDMRTAPGLYPAVPAVPHLLPGVGAGGTDTWGQEGELVRPDLLDRETRPKALVVLNPVAGNSDASIVRQALEENLGNGDWYYEIYETTGQERLADVVRAALGQDFDVFVAAGGDGTVSGVVNGLIHSKHPLGIIPVGTGNTLARELDIPLNIEDALGILIGEHEVRTIDVQTGASSSLPVNHCRYKEMVSSSDIRPCKWTSCPALCR
jgi:predicted polyphosphate/ATP-dependent NAD kinase